VVDAYAEQRPHGAANSAFSDTANEPPTVAPGPLTSMPLGISTSAPLWPVVL